MHAEDLAGDDSGNRKAVEDVDERLPYLDITTPLAFVVEPVHCVREGLSQHSILGGGRHELHANGRWGRGGGITCGKQEARAQSEGSSATHLV